MAIDIFERDHRVIDHAGKCQRQSAQNHGVDGAAHEVQDNDCGHSGDRNGEQNRERRSPASQKHEDHHAGEEQADQALVHHRLQGLLDEDRLIEDDVGLQLLR